MLLTTITTTTTTYFSSAYVRTMYKEEVVVLWCLVYYCFLGPIARSVVYPATSPFVPERRYYYDKLIQVPYDDVVVKEAATTTM